MHTPSMTSEGDLYHKLKWLMVFRVLFAALLLGSTVIVQFNEKTSPSTESFTLLYALSFFILLLTICYALIYRAKKIKFLFPYLQIGIDTFCVTLIILITGSFTSFFSFLYLVVIIYSSMFIFRKGSMIMAALCSIQYGILVDLEYFGVISPYFPKDSGIIGNYTPSATISVSNGGIGTMTWTATNAESWLNLTPSSGTNSGAITLGFDCLFNFIFI